MSVNTDCKRRWFQSLAAVGVIAAALAVTVLLPAARHPQLKASPHDSAPQQTPIDRASIQQANSLSYAFRAASDRVLPAVVMIQNVVGGDTAPTGSESTDQQPGGIPDEFRNNPFFRRFFGDIPQGEWRTPRQVGMGSGVIIDPAGIILTNNHVVAGGGKVTVRLHDGREFVADDVKTDPRTDIAVIRLKDVANLPYASLGNSDQLEIGDWVIAVGSPFGLQETVTAGIISAKARGIGIAEREDFLQTDAAINPGNSGGPLVNLNGEVIGINTAISSTSGGYQGVGFAVPINLAKWVGDQLVQTGSVHRSFLGVGIQHLDSSLARQFGVADLNGALVTDVRPDSPAAKSGLVSGDVIVEFDGQPVNEPRDLQNRVERAASRTEHSLTVLRDGRRMTLKAVVDDLPAELVTSSRTAPNSGSAQQPSRFQELGLQVTDITAELSQQLGIKDTRGVVITDVAGGSPADSAGLEPGMVIQKVGSTPIESVGDFQKAVGDHPLKDGVLLLIRAGEGARFVVLDQN